MHAVYVFPYFTLVHCVHFHPGVVDYCSDHCFGIESRATHTRHYRRQRRRQTALWLYCCVCLCSRTFGQRLGRIRYFVYQIGLCPDRTCFRFLGVMLRENGDPLCGLQTERTINYFVCRTQMGQAKEFNSLAPFHTLSAAAVVVEQVVCRGPLCATPIWLCVLCL